MTDEDRKEREKQLIALLLLLFADYQSQYGTMPDAALVAAFERDAAQRIAPLLASTFSDGASAVGSQVGVNLAADQAAQRWAASYAGSLASELAATTNSRLAEIGTLAQDEQQEALESLFGQDRANAIAVTETTRSNTLGEQYGAEDLADRGIQLFQVWDSERDLKTCPYCKALDGVHEEYWGEINPDAVGGPPLHPVCRCRTRWVDAQGRRPKPPDDEVQLPSRPNKPRPGSNPFELQQVQERETQTATLDLQGNRTGARASGQPLDLDYRIPGKVHAKHGDRRLVTVDVNKLEASWKQSQPAQYIGEQGQGSDPAKLQQAREFLRQAEATNTPVEASVVDMNKQTGRIFVSDGRHRLATLRDMGFTEVQIAVPRSQVKAFEEAYGVDGSTPIAKSLSGDGVIYKAWWAALEKERCRIPAGQPNGGRFTPCAGGGGDAPAAKPEKKPEAKPNKKPAKKPEAKPQEAKKPEEPGKKPELGAHIAKPITEKPAQAAGQKPGEPLPDAEHPGFKAKVEAAHKELTEARDKHGLSPEAVKGIKTYTGDDYTQINSALRNCGDKPKCFEAAADGLTGDPASDKQYGKQLHDAYHGMKGALKKKLPKPVTVYRGVSGRAGQEIADEAEKILKAGKGTIVAQGAVSTSLSPKVTESFRPNVVMRIKAKRGVYVEGISSHEGEMEVTQAHGTKYRPVAVTKHGKITIVDLEEI